MTSSNWILSLLPVNLVRTIGHIFLTGKIGSPHLYTYICIDVCIFFHFFFLDLEQTSPASEERISHKSSERAAPSKSGEISFKEPHLSSRKRKELQGLFSSPIPKRPCQTSELRVAAPLPTREMLIGVDPPPEPYSDPDASTSVPKSSTGNVLLDSFNDFLMKNCPAKARREAM